MVPAKPKGEIARRTVFDILRDICTTCHEIPGLRWRWMDFGKLLIEATKSGHVKCLEAALSLNAEKSAWDRDRSRKYAPGEKPSVTYASFGHLPVLHAANNGRLQCLQLLIEEGFPISHIYPIKPIVLAASICFGRNTRKVILFPVLFSVLLGRVPKSV